MFFSQIFNIYVFAGEHLSTKVSKLDSTKQLNLSLIEHKLSLKEVNSLIIGLRYFYEFGWKCSKHLDWDMLQLSSPFLDRDTELFSSK